jgi:hypothetical protein
MNLGMLAEKFLGPGNWAPREEDRDMSLANQEETPEENET